MRRHQPLPPSQGLFFPFSMLAVAMLLACSLLLVRGPAAALGDEPAPKAEGDKDKKTNRKWSRYRRTTESISKRLFIPVKRGRTRCR